MSTSSRSIVSKFEVKFRREVEKGGSFKSCSWKFDGTTVRGHASAKRFFHRLPVKRRPHVPPMAKYPVVDRYPAGINSVFWPGTH